MPRIINSIPQKVPLAHSHCNMARIELEYVAPAVPPPPPTTTFDEDKNKCIKSIFTAFSQIISREYLNGLQLKYKEKDQKFKKTDIGKQLYHLLDIDIPRYVEAKRTDGHGSAEKEDIKWTMNRLKKAMRDSLGTTSILWRGIMKANPRELSFAERMARLNGKTKRVKL